MRYAIFCYSQEAAVGALTKSEDDAMMAKIGVAKEKLHADGKLRAAARLMPTTTATTVRHGADILVIDGPFAETKEQLLGFYLLDCSTLDEAIEAARLLARDRVAGALEIRPVRSFEDFGGVE